MKQLENGNFVDDNGNLLNGKINWKIFTCWFKQGLLHNENGPAIQYPDYRKDWYLNGIEYSEEEFNNYLEKKKLNVSLQSSLKMGQVNIKNKI